MWKAGAEVELAEVRRFFTGNRDVVLAGGFDQAFSQAFNDDLGDWTDAVALLAMAAMPSDGLLPAAARGLPPIPPLVLTHVREFMKVAPQNYTMMAAAAANQQSGQGGGGGLQPRRFRAGVVWRRRLGEGRGQ